MSGLLALCGCLLAASSQICAGTFNVRDYGAVADGKTDNTAAFSTCLKALVEGGGGEMVLPDGVYCGRIVIPPVSKPTPSWITVKISGESEPTPVFGTIGNFPLQENGTIIKSLDTFGPAVISVAKSPAPLYGQFSAVYVVLTNLDVRTYDNPGIGGIDLKLAMQCRIENVFVNTGIYNVQASKPAHRTSGLITPANSNAALTLLRNVTVTGYHNGIVVSEHTDADNINLASNTNALNFAKAHHASRFGRVCAQRNTHNVTVTGSHGFLIEQLDTEKPGRGQTEPHNAWQTLVSDINDPGNLGIGDINYWVVEGGVGAVESFVKSGGASIQSRRIGSIPVEK